MMFLRDRFCAFHLVASTPKVLCLAVLAALLLTMQAAQPHLIATYEHYIASPDLGPALRQDARQRFDGDISSPTLPVILTQRVTGFLKVMAEARNLSVFS